MSTLFIAKCKHMFSSRWKDFMRHFCHVKLFFTTNEANIVKTSRFFWNIFSISRWLSILVQCYVVNYKYPTFHARCVMFSLNYSNWQTFKTKTTFENCLKWLLFVFNYPHLLQYHISPYLQPAIYFAHNGIGNQPIKIFSPLKNLLNHCFCFYDYTYMKRGGMDGREVKQKDKCSNETFFPQIIWVSLLIKL